MKRLIFIIALLVELTCAFWAKGQLYNFRNYSLEDGLPQSTAYSVYQDTRGYLWVGTESGVARFNGTKFTVFDRTSGLPGNNVRSVIEGSDGNIWVGTDKGVGIFNGVKWRTITAKDGLKGEAVLKLVADSKGSVWAANNEHGVNIISLKGDKVSVENIDSKMGLANDFVLDIYHEANGTTWVAMIGGLSTITFANGKPTIQNVGNTISIPSNLFSCIDQDADGNIWLGTLDAGAFRLKRAGKGYSVAPFGPQQGIADPKIWDIRCEAGNQVWFGTNDNGLYHYSKAGLRNITIKNGLPGNLILAIYRDRNRNLWLGSMNGLSLLKGFHLMHYSVEDGLPGKQVMALKYSGDNTLWVGGDGKGLAKVSFSLDKMRSQIVGAGSGFMSTQVSSIDVDGRGNLIVGTYGDGLALQQGGRFKYLANYDGLASDDINCVLWSKFGSIYAGTNVGYNEIKSNKIYTINETSGLIHPEVQTVIADLNGTIWMGTMGGLARFQPQGEGNYRDFNEKEGLSDLRINALAVDRLNRIYIGTTSGVFRYDEKTDTIVSLLSSSLNAKAVNSLLFYNDTTLIVGTTLGFNRVIFDKSLTAPVKVVAYDKSNGFKFSETKVNAICKDSHNQVWFGTVNGLTRYQPELEDTITETPQVHITGVRLSFEAVDWKSKGFSLSEWFSVPQQLVLNYFQNHVTFDFDGLFLKNPEKVRYRYKLEPSEKNWSPASSSNSVTYPGLNDGDYTFMVSASADGVSWSEPVVYSLTISPPFWKTLWFYISCIVGFTAILVFYIRYRERKLKKEKEHLEQVVKERTAEVVAQRDHIEEQHKIVSAQKQEITSSITYARRIQQAVLPGIEILEECTADCFVLYKPRDIVSGDFYWIGKSNNKLIVAAADCTGHGVPGALMSMLGICFMNKIIREQKIVMPEVVLGQMRSNVITSLKQGNYEGTTKDGMDMALCVIDLDTLMLTFAGAYNPAVVISAGEAQEIKANRMPVGLHIVMDDFTPESLQLQKGDCVYLFSDGYQDQMGGPDGRKFMRKNLRELLVSIHRKPFAEQKDALDSNVENWRHDPALPNGEIDQMDDILIMGFRV